MRIVCTRQVDSGAWAALEALWKRAECVDHGLPVFYPDLLARKRALAANVFCYGDDSLAGFLAVYFFYDRACEISLLVEPALRRQGVARRLVSTILPMLEREQMASAIFSMPSGANVWMQDAGFAYTHTEYRMSREPDAITPEPTGQIPVFSLATMRDIPALVRIDADCFGDPDRDMQTRFRQLLRDPACVVIRAETTAGVIGKAHLRWFGDVWTLSDVAVLPAFQGKGYGYALLAHAVREALARQVGPVHLDVETSNRNALNLYFRLGFSVQNAYDYRSISTGVLGRWIGQRA